TTACCCPAASGATPMWNERFCQNRLFLSSGRETCRHSLFVYPYPGGQFTRAAPPKGSAAISVTMLGVLRMVTNPDGWSVEVVVVPAHDALGSLPGLQFGGGVEAKADPSVLNSTPAEAVVSFEITVLLTNLTLNASCRETPPPSQPATLLAMMLLVTVTSFQRSELRGKAMTS